MKVLTLKHPWPWAIVRLGKDLENRGWRPSPKQLPIGDRFALHGGAVPRRNSQPYDTAYAVAANLFCRAGLGNMPDPDDVFRFGGLFATATLGGFTEDGYGECDCGMTCGCHHAADCPSQRVNQWFDARANSNVGWRLKSLLILPQPIPCKGSQGLWDVPPDVLAIIENKPVPVATKPVYGVCDCGRIEHGRHHMLCPATRPVAGGAE